MLPASRATLAGVPILHPLSTFRTMPPRPDGLYIGKRAGRTRKRRSDEKAYIRAVRIEDQHEASEHRAHIPALAYPRNRARLHSGGRLGPRSEERRVGKEC